MDAQNLGNLIKWDKKYCLTYCFILINRPHTDFFPYNVSKNKHLHD